MSTDRWRGNWQVISPAGSVRVPLGRTRAAARRAEEDVRRLPPETPVVIVASAPRAASRCRRFTARTGIRVDREYLALPTAEAPAYLVEDARASFATFVRTIPPAPSRGLLGVVQEAALSVVRAVRPRRLVRSTAAGRIIVGKRP